MAKMNVFTDNMPEPQPPAWPKTKEIEATVTIGIRVNLRVKAMFDRLAYEQGVKKQDLFVAMLEAYAAEREIS